MMRYTPGCYPSQPHLLWLGVVTSLLLIPAMGTRLSADARLTASQPVQVSAESPDVPFWEPHLAASPTDSNHLFGAAVTLPDMAPNRGLDETIVAGFVSTDGGQNWRRVEIPGCRIDPWTSFSADRIVHVVCLGGSGAEVLVQTSTDGGQTFPQGGLLLAPSAAGADRPLVVSGVDGSPVLVTFGQRHVVGPDDESVFTTAASWSADQGKTFSAPRVVLHDNLEQQPFAASMHGDGTATVLFMDFASSAGPVQHRRTWSVRLSHTSSAPVLPRLAHEQLANEMPWAMAIDRSSQPETLFMVVDGWWNRRGHRPDPAAEPMPLVVRASRADGRWTAPARVTETIPGGNQETPAIAVNGQGIVAVAWYDTRRSSDGTCFDIHFTASVDHGKTFLPSIRLTPEPSCPRAIERQRGLASRWPFGGDYSGLVAAADDSFHVLWADSRSELYQIWTSRVSVRPQHSPNDHPMKTRSTAFGDWPGRGQRLIGTAGSEPIAGRALRLSRSPAKYPMKGGDTP